MKYASIAAAAVASLATTVSAVGVTGSPEGFASGTTGGGDADPVYPDTTDELVSYLGDSEARVIVLSKTFDFTDVDGTETGSGCLPWGTGDGCQRAIDGANGWCENYESDAPSTTITYYASGVEGIPVLSNKSIVGEGNKGIIKGKGLRMANGVENVIIQNIQISDINAEYVWGGDGITLAGTDNIWIDHVTTARIGRQHIVLGEDASGRVSITNHYLDGSSDYSATCDGHHYWAMYFTGSQDQITLKDSYIYYTSGRAPKVQGNTLLHAVNNYWSENSGHAFELADGAYVLAEGNVFENVDAPIEAGDAGQIFTADDPTACADYIGRDCQANSLSGSGDFSQSDTGVLEDFNGYTVPDAIAASSVAANVMANAGMGNLSQ